MSVCTPYMVGVEVLGNAADEEAAIIRRVMRETLAEVCEETGGWAHDQEPALMYGPKGALLVLAGIGNYFAPDDVKLWAHRIAERLDAMPFPDADAPYWGDVFYAGWSEHPEDNPGHCGAFYCTFGHGPRRDAAEPPERVASTGSSSFDLARAFRTGAFPFDTKHQP